jgi:hypothetical protein
LYESVNQIRLGAMPPSAYTLVHPGSVVAPGDLALLERYLHPEAEEQEVAPAVPVPALPMLPSLERLGPEEVAAARERLGLSQRTAGKLLDGGPRAFRKYEAGKQAVSGFISRLLALVANNPKRLRELPGAPKAAKRPTRSVRRRRGSPDSSLYWPNGLPPHFRVLGRGHRGDGRVQCR